MEVMVVKMPTPEEFQVILKRLMGLFLVEHGELREESERVIAKLQWVLEEEEEPTNDAVTIQALMVLLHCYLQPHVDRIEPVV